MPFHLFTRIMGAWASREGWYKLLWGNVECSKYYYGLGSVVHECTIGPCRVSPDLHSPKVQVYINCTF